jgi:hypothetical protein
VAASGYIDCVVGARAVMLTQTETMIRAEAATDAAAVTAAVVVMLTQTTLVALQTREVWMN